MQYVSALGSPIRRNSILNLSAIAGGFSAAVSAGTATSLSLAVKVMKEHNFDSKAAKERVSEELEMKKKQSLAREFAVKVLMDHGVTHSMAYASARRASLINKKTNVSVNLTKELIN